MNQVVIKVIGNYSYQTSRCLGEGVYGKVYEGMERETKQKVAIKKIDLNTFTNDKYLENAIFSEIYLLKRFNHPNIVKFKDVLSSKNSLYIITEFCKHGDLKQLIKRKRFKEEEAFEIMRQLLSGFNELVKEKIIHRDLKPANILINDGIYKIGDFGFAKYVDNFGSQMLKSCVGSPIYMAPQILERTQYTTKCDIWSLGIIFYEMIHGYPPWKARDQGELLRSLKSISITQVLKKSNLSQKGNQFLKKTLAFSQEQRIGWNELFETFGSGLKTEKTLQEIEAPKSIISAPSKQKQRISSTNLSLNQNSSSSPWSHQNKPNSTTAINLGSLSTLNHLNPSSNSSPSINLVGGVGGLHSPYTATTQNPLVTPDRTKPSYYSSSGSNLHRPQTYSGETNYTSGAKKSTQIDNAVQWRQYLIYYHFYCVQMLTNYSSIQGIIGKPELFGKMLYSLATLVKNRSTFCLSMVVMQSKTSKSIDQLYKKMQIQHQSYEMTYNDIVNMLQRNGQYKSLRNQYNSLVGYNQIISEQRMQKMENYMISATTENAQIFSQQVKKRVKNIANKDYSLVEILDYILDVLRLALAKNKAIKQIQEEDKQEDEDIKEFVARVFGKVDRLAANV